MIQNLVINTLVAMGINVVNLDLSTTPTVEIAVPKENADGGIILTASHNPKQWNALKLLDSKGEFLSSIHSQRVLDIASNDSMNFSDVDSLGKVFTDNSYFDKHIDSVISLSYVNEKSIRNSNFRVVVDGVNSTGGIVVPMLLERLGVDVIKIHCDPNGNFPHNPEPLKEHLADLSKKVLETNADFGIAVDPDVDRLAFMDEKGILFGEEYTLVACADYVLNIKKGNTVSNMSSTRALKDLTNKYGGSYTASAVGEVNVVESMKKNNAVIGGEGNGGIILPESHYGRDALVGIALFLSLLSEKKISVSELKKTYPLYFMSKKKINLNKDTNVDSILSIIKNNHNDDEINSIDGVKIDFIDSWVHLRKSNTEPIIRIYSEAKSQLEADKLAEEFIEKIKSIS
jgi:phosphomannomutase